MLEAMKAIINPDVVMDYDTAANKLKLNEDGKESKIKQLSITHMPDKALAFTLDHQPKRDRQKFKQLSLYVNSQNDQGVNKGCDLIILWQEAEQTRALVFDLKSDRPKPEATQRQLDNSALFLKYLLSMAEVHYQVDVNNPIIKKAIVTTNIRNANKRPTHQPNAKPQQPDQFKVVRVNAKPSRTATVSFLELTR